QRSRRTPDRSVALSLVEPPVSVDHIAIVTALAQLPEPTRRAIVLHYVGDLSVADAARELGVAEGTVKSRLSRGREALAALLTDDPSSLTTSTEGASGV
ncbi:MAG: RNA polymerase sigma factor, partial [Lapillicoccus sp.]